MVYDNLDIQFVFEQASVEVSKIANEVIRTPYPLHSHGKDCYELHYVAAGVGRVKIEQREYPLGERVLYITGPGIRHAQFPDGSYHHMEGGEEQEEGLCEYGIYMKVSSLDEKSEKLLHSLRTCPFWMGQAPDSFAEVFCTVLSELEEKKTGYIQSIQGLLQYLLVMVIRNLPSRTADTERMSRAWDARQQLVIDTAFIKEYGSITLNHLAGLLGLSERQTQRLLKEQYGKTFQQKKLEARMSAAQILLADASLSITAVSEQLGYSSGEHFSCAFRRYYGESARAYREHLSRG